MALIPVHARRIRRKLTINTQAVLDGILSPRPRATQRQPQGTRLPIKNNRYILPTPPIVSFYGHVYFKSGL